MKELHTILTMLYMMFFDPTGYVYSRGYFVGFVTSVENRGYIWKTMEGTIKSQKNPSYIEYYREFKLIDCGSERDFSIEDKTLMPVLIKSMQDREPVILRYKKTVRFLNFIYGDEHTFATSVEKI
jgi:hypothetical protein